MATIGGYREGIERLAESLATRQGTATPTPGKSPSQNASTEPLAKVNTDISSPDFVVDFDLEKIRAQELIDSGHFQGEKLEFLKGVVAKG